MAANVSAAELKQARLQPTSGQRRARDEEGERDPWDEAPGGSDESGAEEDGDVELVRLILGPNLVCQTALLAWMLVITGI